MANLWHTIFGDALAVMKSLCVCVLMLAKVWAAQEEARADWVRRWADGGADGGAAAAARCRRAGGDPCGWLERAGAVDVDCTFSVTVGLAADSSTRTTGPVLAASYTTTNGRRGAARATPREPSPADFAARPRLCVAGAPPVRRGAALVVAANAVAYVFRVWPYFASKLLWAESAGLAAYLWVGELPDELATTRGAECEASRVGADGGWSGGYERWAAGWSSPPPRRLTSAYSAARRYDGVAWPHSNHHVKMLAAYAVLDAPSTTAVYFLDMDAVVDPSRWAPPAAPVAARVESRPNRDTFNVSVPERK